MDFREIASRPDDIEALRSFYDAVYVSQFPIADERESLENMAEYLRLKAEGWYGPNNYHIVLGCDAHGPQAASITDYLAVPNAGVIEFLTVADTLRRGGHGRQLLDVTERLLVADAARTGRALDCIVAEMNDPFRQAPADDSLDPFIRAGIWERWGYRVLDFPYIQPALSETQSAVTDLMLLVKTQRPDYQRSLPVPVVKAILREYMRWAMRIDDPDRLDAYQTMSRALDRLDVVPVVRLSHYIGRDAARPLLVRGIADETDPDLTAVLAVYGQAFPGGPTDISPAQLRDAVTASWRRRHYHLWSIRADEAQPVEGMASFFTFPEAGFGGYVALAGSLRGSGRVRLLLARIEEQMVRDGVGARGWYIECDPRQEALFARLGFRTVDCAYRQPPLTADDGQTAAGRPPLRLMYKDFGRTLDAPTVSSAAFLAAIARIFQAVYGIEQPEADASFATLRDCALQWSDGTVRFRDPASATAAT